MGTPVRYYITQDEDRPVVRTVPVTRRPMPKPIEPAAEQASQPVKACSVPRKRGPVRRIVRAAVGRRDSATS